MVINISTYIIFTIIAVLAGVLCRVQLTNGNSYRISGEQFYLYIMFVIFTLLMALRSMEVGVDTSPYSRIFGIISDASSYKDALNNAPLSAPIYILICRTLSFFSKNPQIMIVFSAIFVNVGLFKFIKEVSCDVMLSTYCWIGLTLFYYSMNGNRQCMALVLVLNSLYFLTKDIKSKKGWLLMVIAVGIHSTCLISLIAVLGIFLADKLRDTKIVFIVTAIGSAVIALLFNRIVPFFINLFPRYSMYGTGESKYSIFKSTGGGRIVLLYIFLIAICILWAIANKSIDIATDSFHYRMLSAVVFGAVFGIFNCKNELINRMLWFYIALFISFIPASIEKYNGVIKITLRIGVMLLLGAYSILSLLENQNGVVPYFLFLK